MSKINERIRTDKYYRFNPKTREITIDSFVENDMETPVVFCDLTMHNSTADCFALSKAYFKNDLHCDEGPWVIVHSSHPLVPKEFKTLLILMGIDYE